MDFQKSNGIRIILFFIAVNCHAQGWTEYNNDYYSSEYDIQCEMIFYKPEDYWGESNELTEVTAPFNEYDPNTTISNMLFTKGNEVTANEVLNEPEYGTNVIQNMNTVSTAGVERVAQIVEAVDMSFYGIWDMGQDQLDEFDDSYYAIRRVDWDRKITISMPSELFGDQEMEIDLNDFWGPIQTMRGLMKLFFELSAFIAMIHIIRRGIA